MGEFVRAESTYRFLKEMRANAKLAATFAVGAMAQRAKARCAEMLSLDDHTQKDLNRLGNPYARRHGPEGAGLHDPYQQVHTQTGALAAGLKASAPRATSTGATAEVYNTDEKDPWIQVGTSVMIGRPYMKFVQSAYADEIIQAGQDEFESRLK
jgi:hypothetical protein